MEEEELSQTVRPSCAAGAVCSLCCVPQQHLNGFTPESVAALLLWREMVSEPGLPEPHRRYQPSPKEKQTEDRDVRDGMLVLILIPEQGQAESRDLTFRL